MTTGILSIVAPSVSISTNYSFKIVANISQVESLVEKIINLTVEKCTPSNCQMCSETDSSVCTKCNFGYNLSSGGCNFTSSSDSGINNLKESETAKSLSSSSQAAVGASVGL